MASERIHNEYDATRIANALDTLAENIAGYSPESPVTPTEAMKAKLPSQSTGDRISDAMEGLAQGLTNISHPQRISYEDWSALTPQEKANGTQYYIYDYPSVDGSLYAPVTSVATPENGDTASKAYAVGEMFIRGGKLCTCLVAIAQDGTFVKDTNYKEGDVGSVLTELNSKIGSDSFTTISAINTSAGSVSYRIKNGMCFATFNDVILLSSFTDSHNYADICNALPPASRYSTGVCIAVDTFKEFPMYIDAPSSPKNIKIVIKGSNSTDRASVLKGSIVYPVA